MPRRTPFLSYDLGALSRLYAHEPSLTIGMPYVHCSRWSVNDPSAASAPFAVDVLPGRFVINVDSSQTWREVCDRAIAALRASGHDLLRNEILVRVHEFDATSRILKVQRAEYNDQPRSNLVLDYGVDGLPTLRQMLTAQYGRTLPRLSDNRLANTLGIALLVLLRVNGRLVAYCIRRAKKGVAVFQNTWSCTASGAAKWPVTYDSASFYAGLANDMLEELYEEVGLLNEDLTFFMPVALSRELVRGGKPELFFLAGTHLSPRMLKDRRARARRLAGKLDQPKEVEADTLLKSAARFFDIGGDVADFFSDDIAHQASALLCEARRQYDDILTKFS